MGADSLAGRRILVVEDEMLIALEIEDTLRVLGCVVVGPASTLASALRLVRDETFDAAVLDVTIRGGTVYSVAEHLIARDIPFVLASGYGAWALPETFRNLPCLAKPFSPRELEGKVRLLFETCR